MQRKTTLNEVTVVFLIIWMFLFALFLTFTDEEPNMKQVWENKYPTNSEVIR